MSPKKHTPTARNVRAQAQNRQGLSKVETARAQRTIGRADLEKTPAKLLVELVRDSRVSVFQFRRMAMCAGAHVSDFFDTESGKPYLTKADIMLQISANDRVVTYVPKFITQVSNWLGAAVVRTSDVFAALIAAGIVSNEAAKRVTEKAAAAAAAPQDSVSQEDTTDPTDPTPQRKSATPLTSVGPKAPSPPPPSILPSRDGTIAHTTGALPKVAGVLAASYMVLRSVFAQTYTRRQSRLITLISGEQTHNKDTPFVKVQQLSPLLNKRTYAHTNNCLRQTYDTRLHDIFNQNTKMVDIRKRLLKLRKPWFFGGRTLLSLHLIRRNGQIRDSAAEVAYALLHEYRTSEVFDAAISYSAATFTNIFQGMKKSLGNRLTVFSNKSTGGTCRARRYGGGARRHTAKHRRRN